MPESLKPVEVAALHPGENRFHLAPGPDTRRAIAERLGEPGIDSLKGDFLLRPGSSGVDLDLHLTARVNRICVASLEPMVELVDERYAIRFERDFVESDVDEVAEGLIAREPLEGETLDLEEILIQHLAISLDPHPRKTGAKSLAEDYRDPVNLSPFSGLKGLVDGDA
jgi:uncharacterized metal-binding protein YceD (DUF177 family)